MTAPHYINEHEADIRAIKPGWYGVENNGKRLSGPFRSREEERESIRWWRAHKRTGH